MIRPYNAIFLLSAIILLTTGCNDNETVVPETPTTSEKDRHVLIEIFQQNPDNTLGWDITETDLREWRHLVITDEGRVSGLYLEDKGLTILPAEIGDLEHLTLVEVNGNELTSLPPELGKLTKLEQLDASWNSITSIPDELADLEQLELLILHHNVIATVPSEIGQLSNLRWLYLNDNRLTAVPEELSQLSNLESLAIHNNLITSLPQVVCAWAATLTLSFYVDPDVSCE